MAADIRLRLSELSLETRETPEEVLELGSLLKKQAAAICE